jgi:acetyltransferase-like isoleucine patch superfamily enzyme
MTEKKGLATLGLKNYGNNVTIWPFAKIVQPEVISIGNDVIIDDFVFLMGGKKTVIGDFVHIGSFTSITGGGEFIMEDFSGLSSGVRVFTGHEDYKGGYLTNPTVPEPYRHAFRLLVKIGKHAVVGANTVILAGVTIGEGCAIGTCSLILKDCDPWTIYAGIPAKPIGKRPSEKMLELEMKLRGCF